ncbi:hypothetical protein [Amycolatopsis sp. lyj-84]|uniref:hypothetical protein n=1 Tax=Amycolatopsis sp. lyj-84 TaxID=2789284 RepID=UPI00397E6C70
MKLGTGEASAELHWRRRARWLFACLFLSVGGPSLLLAGLNIRAEITGDKLSRDDAIIAITVLIAVAGLVVFAGQRAAFHGRAVTESLAKTPLAAEAGSGFDAVDEDGETRRLGVLSVRASVFLAISIVLAVAGFVFLVAVGDEIGQSLGALAMVFGVGGAVAAGMASSTWLACHRSVLAAGWREATVTVKPDYDLAHREREPANFDVRFADGETIGLRGTHFSFRTGTRFAARPGARVLVGGEGQAMVILFPAGPSDPLYAVPVRR